MERVIRSEKSYRKWSFFCGLADKGFGTSQLSKFYRKYKTGDLSQEDFDEISKKTSKRKVFTQIKGDYFGKNFKMSGFRKSLRNTWNNRKSKVEVMEVEKSKVEKSKVEVIKTSTTPTNFTNPTTPTNFKTSTKFANPQNSTTPTNVNINLKIQKEIDDDNVIAMCEKFLKSYLNHLILVKGKLNETFYEMIKGNHTVLRKKLYVINVDRSWGKQNLICFDEKTNIYRVGSDVKIGNIKKDEYYFVRGRIAYYYIGEGKQ